MVDKVGFVVSEKKIFSRLPYISLCKTYHHLGGPFLTPGALFEKFGRGPLCDATYQISGLWALWFQTRRFFHVFPI